MIYFDIRFIMHTAIVNMPTVGQKRPLESLPVPEVKKKLKSCLSDKNEAKWSNKTVSFDTKPHSCREYNIRSPPNPNIPATRMSKFLVNDQPILNWNEWQENEEERKEVRRQFFADNGFIQMFIEVDINAENKKTKERWRNKNFRPKNWFSVQDADNVAAEMGTTVAYPIHLQH